MTKGELLAVYSRGFDAEQAIRALERGGFDVRRVTLVAHDFQSEQRVTGPHRPRYSMIRWAAWCGALGLMIWLVLGPLYLATFPGAVGWSVVINAVAVVVLAAFAVHLWRQSNSETLYDYRIEFKPTRFSLYFDGNEEDIERAGEILETRAQRADIPVS